jgi:hypothetical protein
MNTLARLRAGQLVGTQRLQLACGLEEFPREIFELADSLEILDLSGNALCQLPDDLPRLKKLRILFCSDNAFTELPAVLGRCPKLTMIGFKANRIERIAPGALPLALRWLILTDNHLAELPPEIGLCTQLQKLMLAGNQLRTLPPTLAQCHHLELLRVSANLLTELPDALLQLPRLAWLASAGNPFCETPDTAASSPQDMPDVPWHRLTLQHTLGEGASGVIHQALMQSNTGTQAVAVKIFKGEVTSDGLPQCEMAACLRAGAHPHLVPVLGQVTGHPQNKSALVMALIDPAFVNLAGPPSLHSCTRDVYPEHVAFETATALRLALGIAGAARHLHAQGLMHGDLYGHNILHNGDGQAVLGDFGAASFLPLHNPPQALALQRLEVRAFGCLLEELLAHSPLPSALELTLHKALTRLKIACLNETPQERPLFSAIEQALSNLI